MHKLNTEHPALIMKYLKLHAWLLQWYQERQLRSYRDLDLLQYDPLVVQFGRSAKSA